MKKNKIVFSGNIGKISGITMRYPQPGDVHKMCQYINEISAEETFVRFQKEKITLKAEEVYLANMLLKIKTKQAVQLLVFTKNKLIGISEITMNNQIESHIGTFGISVLKEYRNNGIGKYLMAKIIGEAKATLPSLKIINLGVFETNKLAIKMYKKLGFVQYGLLPKGVYRKKSYEDHIYMYKNV